MKNKLKLFFSEKVIRKITKNIIALDNKIIIDFLWNMKISLFWSEDETLWNFWIKNIAFIYNNITSQQKQVLLIFKKIFNLHIKELITNKDFKEYYNYIKEYDNEILYDPYFIHEYSNERWNNFEFFINFPFCNNKCYFCHTHSIHSIKRLWFCSDKIIEIFEKNSKDKNVSFVDFYWWEPTIHKDFFILVDYFNRQNLKLSLATNGRFLQNIVFAKKVAKVFNSIRISFHDSDYETFDNITWIKWSFEETVTWIKNLWLIWYRWLTINIVITKININRLSEIIKFILTLWQNFTIKLSGLVFDTLTSYEIINDIYPWLLDMKKAIEKAINFLDNRNIRYIIEKIPFCLLDIRKECYQSEWFNNHLRITDGICNTCKNSKYCTLFSKYQYNFINQREKTYYLNIRKNYIKLNNK